MSEDDSKYYLRVVGSLMKLHVNSSDLSSIPSLLEFYSYAIKELAVVQMKEMGMDLLSVIDST